jgi:ribose-phosphate pyrophosphokinase
LIDLCLVNNAIKHKYGSREKVYLSLPYIPCGRQDRVVHKGESLSLEVVSDIINTCGFEYVYTLDPHSSVTGNFVKNLVVIPNNEFISNVIIDIKTKFENNKEFFIFAPDEGASKKIYTMLSEIGISPEVVIGSKSRNNVGQITKYGISYDGNLNDLPKNCIIIDDICDGGATFTNASKKLRESIEGLENVYLAVTHGLFTKGLEPLLVDGNINHIYTTNSVCKLEENEHLTIFRVL